MEEMVIDLKDFVYRILKRWRQLVIWMLACAVVFTVIGGVKSYQTARDAQAKRDAQIAAGGPAEGEKEIVVPEVEWVSVKNIVFGVIVGAIPVCCWVAVPYLMSGKLRTKGDMKAGFNVTLLGSVSRGETKKRKFDQVDHWLEKVFFPEKEGFSEADRIGMICTDIKLAAQRAQMKKLYLTGAGDDAEADKLMALVCEKLGNCLDQVSCGKSVVYDAESLESLVESDGVVLIERVDVSAYKDIEKELEFCKRYEVPVIGCIVIE